MQGVGHIPSSYGTLCDPPPVDRAIARVAERQHGLVTLAQLGALGLSASAARNRVTAGRLHRVRQGVYAVGHPLLGDRGNWMADVLTFGLEAVLSHRSAAGLWGLLPDARAVTDVSLPRRSARPRPGIAVHRCRKLAAEDVTTVDGIPCTTVARTLLDVAEVLDRRGLERAVEQAEVLRRFDGRAVGAALARANGRRGAGRLRAALADATDPALTASELEERFLALCLAAGIRRPEVNPWIAVDAGEYLKVDFLWRAERLVVETDGRAFHGHQQAFGRDHGRDLTLRLAGWRVRRFTGRQVSHQAERVVRDVRAALAEPH